MREACWCCDFSDCKVKTGAVAVSNGTIVARGHNYLSIEKLQKEKNERDLAIHAEEKLIKEAAEQHLSLKDCALYLTRFPCESCAKLLTKAGVKKIYYMSDLFTLGNKALPFLTKNNIEVVQIKEEEVWK